MTVTFVCTGNTCRSPMAEAILQSLAEAWGWEMRVLSAGLYASAGATVSANAQTVLEQQFHIPGFYHSAQPMTKELFVLSDLVVGMTGEHALLLKERFGDDPKITAFPTDVGDPWGGDLDDYEHCAKRIVAGLLTMKDEGILHA